MWGLVHRTWIVTWALVSVLSGTALAQGQMSAWFVMAALGLFQTDGACRVDPIYEIGSPLFEETVLHLGQRYGRGATFNIEANRAQTCRTCEEIVSLSS